MLNNRLATLTILTAAILAGLSGCRTAQPILESVTVRDTVIVTDTKYLIDTLEVMKDTVIYQDKVRLQLQYIDRKVVVEADQFFQTLEGYKFDGTKLREAHLDCQARARAWLKKGNIAIVSNTFTQRWEYEPYLDMATQYNVPVQVIEVHGDFENIHGVPPDKIESMRKRWEAHI